MTNRINRRDFLVAGVVSTGLVSTGVCASSLPGRMLGRTGVSVSILGFGGGSRFLMYEDEEEALQILNEAVDEGINYLDTAMSYGNGKSEQRYGKFLKHRRREVFLATKVQERGYDEALRALEQSLKRLQTDQVDLLHIHSLGEADDLERIERPDGVLGALYRAREEKMARFIGVTSHTDARTLKTAIERHDLDCVQMALNAATRIGYSTGFEQIALPAARQKNLGILAMKVTGQEQILGNGQGRAPIRDLLYYSLSLPVAVCVVGMPQPEFVRENIALARNFTPLDSGEKERIRQAVEPSAAALDRFLVQHRDGEGAQIPQEV